MAIFASSDTLPVGETDFTVLVNGAFALPYQVKATPNWLTEVGAVDKTSLSYTLLFGTSAPADAFVDVIVVSE